MNKQKTETYLNLEVESYKQLIDILENKVIFNHDTFISQLEEYFKYYKTLQIEFYYDRIETQNEYDKRIIRAERDKEQRYKEFLELKKEFEGE